jgi:hypothetical protein
LKHDPLRPARAAGAAIVAALALSCLPCGPAYAHSTPTAHYRPSLAGIEIGAGDWSVDVDKDHYTAGVVCGMSYRPVAGYNTGAFRVNYLEKARDMEMWFAPIAGTRLLAMFRISIPTMLGIAVMGATRFESAIR